MRSQFKVAFAEIRLFGHQIGGKFVAKREHRFQSQCSPRGQASPGQRRQMFLQAIPAEPKRILQQARPVPSEGAEDDGDREPEQGQDKDRNLNSSCKFIRNDGTRDSVYQAENL